MLLRSPVCDGVNSLGIGSGSAKIPKRAASAEAMSYEMTNDCVLIVLAQRQKMAWTLIVYFALGYRQT